MAFTHTTVEGVEVWVLDVTTSTATKLAGVKVNANIGDAISWFEDSQSVLVKIVSDTKKELIDTKNCCSYRTNYFCK